MRNASHFQKIVERQVRILNKVILIGNLAADPESRTTQSGISQCTLRLAVQRRFANQQGVREADFFTVICWRQTADFAARYLSKGRKIAVEGSIQNRSYDAQDGSKRYVTEIIADNVEFCDSRPDRPPSRRPAMASRRRAGSPRWTTTSFRSDGFAVVCGAGLPAPRIQRPCRAGFAAGSAGR